MPIFMENRMETDVKTKYLDITQLPVSEEQEPSFEDQQQSFYKSILGKYTEF